jgi:hypothetical protein
VVIKESKDVQGVFDMGGLMILDRINMTNPDTLMIGGASMKGSLPKHDKSVHCYTVEFDIPDGQKPLKKGVCIDNIYLPPAGSWLMTEGSRGASFAPSFQGNTNPAKNSGRPQIDADAPQVCFDVAKP